uniref:Uncharacterized protein n=1 Tax=Picea glauca TaxID=3330 RepID=A0A101LW37_PICGL|nr:hypothetical protein ABT39_MTgene1509 [Picea glauca]
MIDILAWFESEMPPVSLIWGGSAVPLPAPGGSLYLNVQGHSGSVHHRLAQPSPIVEGSREVSMPRHPSASRGRRRRSKWWPSCGLCVMGSIYNTLSLGHLCTRPILRWGEGERDS